MWVENHLTKTYQDNLAEEIINNHVDLNMEIFGKQVSDTDVVLLDGQSQILYSPPKIQEEIYDKKRELQKTQDPIEMEANVLVRKQYVYRSNDQLSTTATEAPPIVKTRKTT